MEGELTCVPKDVAEARGPYVTALNLSENKISSGENLEHFTKLESLVLDKNEIEVRRCCCGCTRGHAPAYPAPRTLNLTHTHTPALVALW